MLFKFQYDDDKYNNNNNNIIIIITSVFQSQFYKMKACALLEKTVSDEETAGTF